MYANEELKYKRQKLRIVSVLFQSLTLVAYNICISHLSSKLFTSISVFP